MDTESLGRDRYDPNDATREDLNASDEIQRGVRASAFFDVDEYVQCAYRNGIVPDGRSNHIGFRAMLRGPPVV